MKRVLLIAVFLCGQYLSGLTACLAAATVTAAQVNEPAGDDVVEAQLSASAIWYDPGFEQFVDIGLLQRALAEHDPGLLADCALQFAEGERVLHRRHNAITAQELLERSVSLATDKHAVDVLARLERAATQLELPDLAATLDRAKKLSGTERTAQARAVPALSPNDTNPATFRAFAQIRQHIADAQVSRDRSQLDATQQLLDRIDDVTIRARCAEMIDTARNSLPEATDRTAQLLGQLLAESRGGSSGQLPARPPTGGTGRPGPSTTPSGLQAAAKPPNPIIGKLPLPPADDAAAGLPALPKPPAGPIGGSPPAVKPPNPIFGKLPLPPADDAAAGLPALPKPPTGPIGGLPPSVKPPNPIFGKLPLPPADDAAAGLPALPKPPAGPIGGLPPAVKPPNPTFGKLPLPPADDAAAGLPALPKPPAGPIGGLPPAAKPPNPIFGKLPLPPADDAAAGLPALPKPPAGPIGGLPPAVKPPNPIIGKLPLPPADDAAAGLPALPKPPAGPIGGLPPAVKPPNPIIGKLPLPPADDAAAGLPALPKPPAGPIGGLPPAVKPPNPIFGKLPLPEDQRWAYAGVNTPGARDMLRNAGKTPSDLYREVNPQLSDGQISLLERPGAGINVARQYRDRGISINDKTIVRDLHSGNVVGSPQKLGSGAFNAVYLVKYATRPGQEFVFKPEKGGSGEWVAVKSGIDMNSPRFGSRNVATHALNRMLGFDVVPSAEFGSLMLPNAAGVPESTLGLVMSRAGGQSPYVTQSNVERAVAFNYTDGNLRRELIKLQLLDGLCAQGDRHGGNYLIQKSPTGAYKVTGIDNDQSFGMKVTDPNQMIQGPKGSGREGYRGVGLPLVVDTEMAAAFRSIKPDQLRASLDGLVTTSEVESTVSRLNAINAHIDTLEASGRVIAPNQWSSSFVTSQLGYPGFGSYVQRESTGLANLMAVGRAVAAN